VSEKTKKGPWDSLFGYPTALPSIYASALREAGSWESPPPPTK